MEYQKTAEVTSGSINDKITKISQNWQQNDSETVTNNHDYYYYYYY